MSDIWTHARQAARTHRAHLQLSDDATATETIAAALANAGLCHELLAPGDALLSGAHAVLDRDSDAVWVRDDVPAAPRAYLVAHELAHFHLHPEYTASDEYEGATESDAEGAGAFLVGYGPRERRESEANVWARELILPAHMAHRLFFREDVTAPQITDRFGVPLGVVLKQLQTADAPVSLAPPCEPAPLPLDASQHAAATHPATCPLLLGAGPGTGKTRTLVARVKHLLKEDNAPETVLVLTFSRKASAELRERLEKHLPVSVARRVAVCTFHAFGLDLLRRYHRRAGLSASPTLLGDAETFALMETRIADFCTGDTLWYPHDPLFPLRDTLRLIGRLKEEMVTPSDTKTRATGDPKRKAFAAIYDCYERTLRGFDALDSADLVCRAVSLLSNNADLREREQARWRHVLVDEYQDVNRAGAKLVQLLGGDGSGVWCVGDLRQAIYRFRGASPANVSRFGDDFPGGERRDLAVNYRSRPPLVSCFGQLAGEHSALWDADRTAHNSANLCITLAVADTGDAQIAGIAHTIADLRERHPEYAWRDFAVLCRTNPQARAASAALQAHGVPVAGKADALAWLRDATVRELLLLLSLTDGKTSLLATRTGRTLPASLASKTTPAAFLTAALYGVTGIIRAASDPRPAQNLLATAQSWENVPDLCVPGENKNATFLRHIRRIARLGQEPQTGNANNESETDAPDAVVVQTVHAAKGLEYAVVFVPNLSKGQFPPQARPDVWSEADVQAFLGTDSATDADEETRLFFVACTRARDYLTLSFAERPDGRAAQPSPLLTPLGAIREVSHIRWTGTLPAQTDTPIPSTQRPTPNTSPTPAHQLERYLRCPRRYFYETVQGLGVAREHSGYDALKAALRRVMRGLPHDIALSNVWAEYELNAGDPWLPAYRAEWDTMLSRLQTLGELRPAPPYTVALSEGTVTVRADGVAGDGGAERISFAKTKETGKSDAGNTLLFSAAPQGTVVRVRHIRTGEERIMEDTKNASTRRARESHLESYNRALRGIRLQMFPREPDDATGCASCAYLLICE